MNDGHARFAHQGQISVGDPDRTGIGGMATHCLGPSCASASSIRAGIRAGAQPCGADGATCSSTAPHGHASGPAPTHSGPATARHPPCHEHLSHTAYARAFRNTADRDQQTAGAESQNSSMFNLQPFWHCIRIQSVQPLHCPGQTPTRRPVMERSCPLPIPPEKTQPPRPA